MKYKKIIPTLICAAVVFTACTTETQTPPEEKPVYNTNITTTTTTAPETTTTAETTENQREKDLKEYRALYHEDEILVDFSGVSATQESPTSVNPAFYNVNFTDKSLITHDGASDTLYYVNYGKEDFLYAYKDGKSELLIEMKVNFPNYYDGDIYFLSNEKTMPIAEYQDIWGGSLYKYNVSSKTTELVLEGAFCNLGIQDGYLYFSAGFDSANSTLSYDSYRMKIGGELEDIGYSTRFSYGEYQLVFEPVPEVAEAYPDMARSFARLSLASGDETIPLTGVGDYSWDYFCISGNEFWLLASGTLYCVNLDSGETKSYTANTYETPDGSRWKLDGIESFVVAEGVLHVAHHNTSYVFRYDYDEEQFIPLVNFGTEFGTEGYAFFRIYAVGADVYAYGQNPLGKDTRLIKHTPLGDGTYEKTEIYA